LQAVTQQQNNQLTHERGRANSCNGEKSGKTNLTDREAMTIRYLAQVGMPRKDIATMIIGDKAKHPMVTVNRIIERTRFGHLDDPADVWTVYPTIVAATARTDLPVNDQISNAAMGLAGEAGEVIDALKKHLYQGHDIDPDEIVEELGDVLFYWTWLAVLLFGFDRAEVMLRNMDKLRNRYPNGFEVERSLNRQKGDI
jgi:NTP pyrophosphatase (non-canonical NTP hydrolase)